MPPLDSILPDSAAGGDTIVAVSTPPGRGGIGVVRLSGPNAVEIGRALTGGGWKRPEPRRTTATRLADAEGRTIDRVMATWFQGPRSYTGEDVVEIACHGSPPVLAFAVERAMELGARLAEPGEFTLRAFLHGKLDLAQAEAVGELIEASTLYQARTAMQRLEGGLALRIAPVKRGLLELIARLEAGIDFAEDDVEVAPAEEILERLETITVPLRALAESYRYGKVVRGGATVAVLGRPNVGKSSLFNRILMRERAIVSPLAGTTRDVVGETADLDGVPVRLLDTAGVRAATDAIEALGVERAWQAAAEADAILVVVDLSAPVGPADRELIERARASARSLVVGNKADLPRAAEPFGEALVVSATTGAGVEELRRALREVAAPAPDEGYESAFVASLRQERLLRESVQALENAATAVRADTPHEMALLDLYAALRPLDAVTGATGVDDVLASIFSTFCIGK